ncbi:MAG: methylated-DNA--[protein]-cysteine S-methyltransferase [Caldilineaceae bacterium]
MPSPRRLQPSWPRTSMVRERTFRLPLAPQGTPFQRAVWAQLLQVPFGETATYRDIALALDNADGVRREAANGRNRIAVIVPCPIASSAATAG